MNGTRCFLLLSAVALLCACATVPAGPNVSVMPGKGKTFEAFQTDDAVCRQWAGQQAGGAPGETANRGTAGGAALGTLLGAALGAGIGAATGSAGAGAAIGGATGLIGGLAVGSGQGRSSGLQLQRRYDNAYEQCMYSKGNQIPGIGQGYPTIGPPPSNP